MTTVGMMTILPPNPGTCPDCAGYHAQDEPHNRESLYYQMAFQIRNGRAPTWDDAMAHCPPELQELWRKALADFGQIVEAQE